MVKKLYNEVMERIEKQHIGCFEGMEKPLFLISTQYPGLWLEHVYDSVLLSELEPKYLSLAENAINVFIDHQRENGQLPFSVMDVSKATNDFERVFARYTHTQECVSFYTLALEVYEKNQNRDFLERIYESGKGWDNWLRKYRMTTGRGLVEMFFGFDTGHDNSGRLDKMSCKGNYTKDGVKQSAETLPPDDGITPILAVDMNANLYANEKSLEKMATLLGKSDEAKAWAESAKTVKQRLFEHCFDEKDAFFYDVDRNGNKRKYKSSTIFHLFMERVLDKNEDRELIERIYNEHIKNPDEFWTEYPFPSMAINDPSTKNHDDFNCWGYYTQGLIVLRCKRWMDYYGYQKDFDYILKRWIESWTEHYDTIKFAQEIDPITGVPTKSSEWYSSCMLNYVYGARRLGLV